MVQEIDEATSKRICSHMNHDHASTTHGIVMRCIEPGTKFKINDAKLKNVSLMGMTLSHVQCSGDFCEMKTTFVPFDPPLTAVAEVRPRMIEIHNKVCAPQVAWLFTNPLAAGIVIVCSLIGYAVLVLGVDNLSKVIQGSPLINQVVSALFGSAPFFCKLLFWSWYLTVFAHGAEAFWVAYQCHQTLKLKFKPTAVWFLLVCCTGYPITNEFVTLWKVHVSAKAAKKQS